MVLGYALSAGVTFVLAIYIVLHSENDDDVLKIFGFLLVGVITWSLASSGRLLTPTLGGKIIWQFVRYLAVVTVPPAFFLFVATYTGRSNYVTSQSLALFAIEPAIVFTLLFTNDSHGLYYQAVGLDYVQATPVLATTAGPGFWAHTLYSYILIGAGVFLLLQFALTADRLYRVQVVALLSGALLPIVANGVFLLGVTPNPALDITPPAFALSSLLIFVGVVYGRFSQLLPVDRETILSAVEDGILVANSNDQVTYANPSAKDILSMHAGANGRFVGEPLSEVVPVVTAQATEPTKETSGQRAFEVSSVKDGRQHWFWIRKIGLGEESTGATVVLLADITTRKERQRRRARLQGATRELIDVDDREQIAAVAVDTITEVMQVPVCGLFLANDDASRLDGIEVSEAYHELFDAEPNFDRDTTTLEGRLVWEAFDNGEPVRIPETHDSAKIEGEPTVRGLAVYPLSEHGVVMLASDEVGAFDDATPALLEIWFSVITGALDQAEGTRILRDNKQQLERQNERLEEFTSVVSHDLRSPINTVNGYVELLQDDYDDPRITGIHNAVERMETLVNDLLTLARQGKTVDTTTTIDLDTTAQRAWDSTPTPDASIDIESTIGHVAADGSRLREALENLFRNAIENTDGELRIRIGTLSDGEGFFVEDNGPGIPPDQRDRVFEHGYTTGEAGTGLGLAIVKRIIEAHGWEIRVTEGRDGGARFEVTGVDFVDAVDESP
ncbi:histidine kinase N-terminal 7TM domain-containing protein [Salinibaculum rarum]|uniref:histidine kinase N-terminal 7TM domain-containing protein n=1 Tax=Salinibaculum rarum TaxID=3058903 RepID=UPI00265F9660|nr:histidine kinase N-terminal 7TM domain-containing protein [Salinibaculum sp. KK48]